MNRRHPTLLATILLGSAGLQIASQAAPPPEQSPASRETRADSPDTRLRAYLDREFPTRINRVVIGEHEIEIRGDLGGTTATWLAEIPMDRRFDDPERFEHLAPIESVAGGEFTTTLPRFRERDGRDYDRLTSRWQLVRREDGRHIPASHARYADVVPCRHPDLPAASPKSKKGLGGWSAHRGPDGELEALDIASITVNVVIDRLLSPEAGPDTIPFTWQGRRFHADAGAVRRLDQTFRTAAEHDVMVSAILLVSNPARGGNAIVQTLGHPDADPAGTFAMPDVTSSDGLATYGAILDFMAARWTRPDGKYGRVHHWIIHNEVDAGWTWTNAGRKSALAYMALYHRSMRLAHLVVRRHDPHARPFISLTHHWAETVRPKYDPARTMLELLADFSRAEGDFPWGIAHHPYPQSLHDPRTWGDEQATFDFDTRKITPRNLEVLDAFVRQPRMRYRGRDLRPVHLSENGFNTPDESPESLTNQAAGMAYAWKKIAPLETVKAWHYHNWIDNRHEGGLRLGLRHYPDHPDHPLAPKPVWHLYQNLATPRENDACAPYLDVIGIESWQSIRHTDPIR